MASELVKLTEYGYGQLELNLVAFPRTGRVVAQYKAGNTFIGASREEDIPVENGMLLKVDGVNRCVDMAAPAVGNIYALNYSTEHMYDERTYRLADYKLNPVDDFYPRLGYLDIGDKFTTNTVCIQAEVEEGASKKDKAAAAKEAIETAMKAGVVFGGAGADGYIKLNTTADEFIAGPLLRVVELYTMPDGQPAVKLEVIRA